MAEFRTRNWFLTINDDAECFKNFINIIKDNIDTFKHYAYILHDKDNEEQPHYHACLEFKNARTFTQVKSKFEGAHINDIEFKNMSYQYLIHKNDFEKFQYKVLEVACDDRDYLTLMINNDEYEKLDTKNLLEKINSGVSTYSELITIFGIRQVNIYHNLINKLLGEKIESIVEHKNNEIKRLEQSNRDLFNYLTSLYNVLEDKDIDNDFIKEVIMPSIQRMILDDKIKKGDL